LSSEDAEGLITMLRIPTMNRHGVEIIGTLENWLGWV
jgi:hypothetical protein